MSRELCDLVTNETANKPWLTEFLGDRSLKDLQHIMQGRCLPSEHLGKDQHGFGTRFCSFFFVGAGGGKLKTGEHGRWSLNEFDGFCMHM